jgi:hypothetical protein
MEHNHPDTERCGEKCGEYATQMAMPMGAMSWDEVDAAAAASEAAEHAAETVQQFQGIVAAVTYSDLTPDEKAARIAAAAAGLTDRMRTEMADADKGYKPGRIARLFGAKVTNSDGLGPDDYAVVPDAEKPSTWKLRIDDAAHVSGAIQALSPAGFRGERVQLAGGERAEALRKIAAAIRRIPEADRGNLTDRLAALKTFDEPTRDGSVVLFGNKAGEFDRFAMWASNNFRDREGEVFSAASIEDALQRFNARQGAKGYANIWHVGAPKYGWHRPDLTDWGEIEHAAYADGFVFVEGAITDQHAAKEIAAWAKREPLGTSIEYRYWDSDLEDGVYSRFDLDRVSVLPRSRAANPWAPATTITLSRGETEMPFSDQKQREALEVIYGPEQIQEWETQAKARANELRESGVGSKELRFEVQAPVSIRYIDEVKDGEEPAVEAEAVEAPAAAPVSDAPPAWAAELLGKVSDLQAAITANQDQVKALKAEVEGLPPAAGILGRSIQTEQGRAVYERVIGAANKEAEEAERGQPLPNATPGGYDPGSAVAKAMAQMAGRVNGNDKAASH